MAAALQRVCRVLLSAKPPSSAPSSAPKSLAERTSTAADRGFPNFKTLADAKNAAVHNEDYTPSSAFTCPKRELNSRLSDLYFTTAPLHADEPVLVTGIQCVKSGSYTFSAIELKNHEVTNRGLDLWKDFIANPSGAHKIILHFSSRPA